MYSLNKALTVIRNYTGLSIFMIGAVVGCVIGIPIIYFGVYVGTGKRGVHGFTKVLDKTLSAASVALDQWEDALKSKLPVSTPLPPSSTPPDSASPKYMYIGGDYSYSLSSLGWNGDGWYFWNETKTILHGPYADEKTCATEFTAYVDFLGDELAALYNDWQTPHLRRL